MTGEGLKSKMKEVNGGKVENKRVLEESIEIDGLVGTKKMKPCMRENNMHMTHGQHGQVLVGGRNEKK